MDTPSLLNFASRATGPASNSVLRFDFLSTLYRDAKASTDADYRQTRDPRYQQASAWLSAELARLESAYLRGKN